MSEKKNTLTMKDILSNLVEDTVVHLVVRRKTAEETKTVLDVKQFAEILLDPIFSTIHDLTIADPIRTERFDDHTAIYMIVVAADPDTREEK